MRANTLIGEKVRNVRGDYLGDIKEIVLEMRSGKVAYAVLSFGGVFTMGQKLFAVPWDALLPDTLNKSLVLDVDKDRFKDAPGFDSDKWPNMTDRAWSDGIHNYYGQPRG
jgi:hypothetical protein